MPFRKKNTQSLLEVIEDETENRSTTVFWSSVWKWKKKTAGGIYIPDSAKEKPMKGEIVAAGPGKLDDSGNRAEMSVKEGDLVLFAKYAGMENLHRWRRTPGHARGRYPRHCRLADHPPSYNPYKKTFLLRRIHYG